MKSDPFDVVRKYVRPAEQQHQADISEGRILALKIDSHVLNACIWLALDESFTTDDGLAMFYASEIPLLRHKSEEMLREIHKARVVFSGGKVIPPEKIQ